MIEREGGGARGGEREREGRGDDHPAGCASGGGGGGVGSDRGPRRRGECPGWGGTAPWARPCAAAVCQGPVYDGFAGGRDLAAGAVRSTQNKPADSLRHRSSSGRRSSRDVLIQRSRAALFWFRSVSRHAECGAARLAGWQEGGCRRVNGVFLHRFSKAAAGRETERRAPAATVNFKLQISSQAQYGIGLSATCECRELRVKGCHRMRTLCV